MAPLAAQTLFVIACLLIVWRAEPANNRMSRATPLLIRIAFNLLIAGAVACVLDTLLGSVPRWQTVLLAWGVAALLFCERRIMVLTRIRSTPPQDKGPHHA